MAAPTVDVARGVTIVFGTSAFSAEITDMNWPTSARESLDTSHQGTTNAMTFMPADLYDEGELTFDIHFNPDRTPPTHSAAEQITITGPSGNTWVFSGFATAYSGAGPLNGLMTGSVTLKVADEISITA